MRYFFFAILSLLLWSCSDDSTNTSKSDMGAQDLGTSDAADMEVQDSALDVADFEVPDDASTDSDSDADMNPEDMADLAADMNSEDMNMPLDGAKCASWDVETIFPIPGHDTTRAGDSSALVFDVNNAAHISFSTNLGLYYGNNVGGTWTFELIPSPRPVSATAIAVNTQGVVDIVYYEGENFDVRQVTNASGSWVTTVIADEGIVGEDLTMTKDSQGRLHIAYLDGTRSTLIYGVRNGGVWSLEDAVSNTPGRPVPSMIIEGGEPLISFENYQQGLKLATRVAGVWSNEIIDAGSDQGGWSSIAMDSSGALHISYIDFMVGNSRLRYTTNASGQWDAQTLEDQNNTGWNTTLREFGGVIHIVFLSTSPSGELRYASNDGSGWTTSRISEASGYSKTSMEFSPDGQLAISFKRGMNALGFATCVP